MQSRPRYQKLGLAFDFPCSLEEAASEYAEGFVGLDQYNSRDGYYVRERDIYLALEMVALWHLQFPGAQPPEPWLQCGVECALQYFLENWICDDPEAYDMVRAKEDRDTEVCWYEAFSRGLILCLLSEKWDDVDPLCSWVWADLVPEYSGMGGDLEDEVAQMYVIVAASFRSEPMQGLDELTAKVRRCRTKRPRLLMELWDAVLAKDQAAFDKAIHDSLKHHASRKWDSRSAKIAERLALPQTAICLAAMRHGLTFPNLPDELVDYLITRDSLGLK